MSLFPEDRTPPAEVPNPVQIRLNQMTLRHPRQWGGCWLALELWNQLDLDSFWASRLPESRKGTGWLNVLKTLVTPETFTFGLNVKKLRKVRQAAFDGCALSWEIRILSSRSS